MDAQHDDEGLHDGVGPEVAEILSVEIAVLGGGSALDDVEPLWILKLIFKNCGF